MTTTIKVFAHCDDETEVQVITWEDGEVLSTEFLQDGEEGEAVVFSERVITIVEAKRQTNS